MIYSCHTSKGLNLTDPVAQDTSLPHPTYWHGGVPGIAVGKRIRAAAGLSELPKKYQLVDEDQYPCDPKRVYVTTDVLLAESYAAAFGETGQGSLYRVEPSGELHGDPDYANHPGVSYSCSWATVLEVVKVNVESTREQDLYHRRFEWLKDGTPAWDEDGYALPSPAMRKAGITPDFLRTLGNELTNEQLSNVIQKWCRLHGISHNEFQQWNEELA